VWLGDRYGEGATALAILVSYWLLWGGLLVTPGFLVGSGRAREIGLVYAGVAVANLVLALVLTPELGLEGPALATAVPFVVAFPIALRVALGASGASAGELARRRTTSWAGSWPGCWWRSGWASSPTRCRRCCSRPPSAFWPTGSRSTGSCSGRRSGPWSPGSCGAEPLRPEPPARRSRCDGGPSRSRRTAWPARAPRP
jgi:Polysaccharide biosynthesis C-terminal domain